MKEETKQKIEKKKTAYTEYANENKQRVFTWLAYLVVLVVAVLSAFLQVLFDTDNFNVTRFVTNLCFSVGISVIILILSMKDGELNNETSKKGYYYEAKQRFKNMLALVVDREIFKQFCDVLYERERANYIDDQLSQFQVVNTNYMKVSEKDLEQLKEEPKKCVIGYDQEGNEIIKPLAEITETQYQAIMKYKSGEFRFQKLDYTFFTAKSGKNNYSYQADVLRRQHKLKIYAVLYRVIMIVILNGILALAMVNPNKTSIGQILFDVASRILALVTSMVLGYMIANDIKKQNAEQLEFKSDVIQQFIDEKDTGAFKPVDREQELMNRINAKEEQRKKEQEEREKNIITPEVITPQEKETPKDQVLEIEMTAEQYEQFISKN